MQKNLKLVVCVLALFSVSQASAWSAKGHCVIAHIADQNLTPKARKMCDKYLGHSLAYYASWMDRWRYSEEYHHTARWHAVGLKNGEFVPGELVGDTAYFGTPLTMDDHGVARLEQLQKAMKDYRHLPDSAVSVNLKCIIHMVGDMHCPGHLIFADQKQYAMQEGGKPLRYHGYIDKAFGRFNKNKTAWEFRQRYCHLTEKEVAELCKGDMKDWIMANTELFRETYKLLSPTVDYEELPEQNKLRIKDITDQLYIDAGYRLAHFINQIFK